jgi:pyroglutamyl-peptidase
VTRPVILLTGFEPFGGLGANPSEEVAKALDGRVAGDAVVRSAVLPVDHAAAAVHVGRLIDELDPRAIVHLGLAAGRARIALERVAVNVMDFATPDNTGYRACNEPCVAGGPPAYFATLPLPDILQMLLADGVPAYVSNTAGTYLCNQTMYSTLHRLAQRGHVEAPRGSASLVVRAGFVHLPLLPAMVAASALEQPSMDAALMVRAVEIVIGVVARAA